MQKTPITVYLFLLCLLFAMPLGTSEAYYTTGQSATRLGESHVLFTVTYQLGSNRYDYHTPALVERSERTDIRDRVQYQLVDEKEVVYAEGEVAALVLAETPLTDNKQYRVPQGEGATLELIALAELPTDTALPDELALRVTRLPFDLVTSERSFANGLNPSELDEYQTPFVEVGALPRLQLGN